MALATPATRSPRLRRADPLLALVAGPDRGAGLPELGPRRRPRRRWLRRRRGPRRGLGAARRRRRRAGRHAGRGAGRDGEGAGTQQHGAARPPGGASRRGVGAHPADDLGRAGLRRARRQLVLARAPAGLPAGQRRRLRRQAAQPRRGPGARPGHGASRARSGCSGAARTWCATGRSGRRSPSASGPTARAWCGSAGHRARPTSVSWGNGSAVAPGVVIEEVDIVGPPVAAELRGAGWVEVLAALHALEGRRAPGRPADGTGPADVTVPGGGRATVSVRPARRPARPRHRLGRGLGRRGPPSRHPALLRPRCRPSGARTGLVRGDRGRRRRRPARPHHPVLRHSGRARDAPGRGHTPRGRPLAGQRIRRRVRRHRGRGLDRRGPVTPLAHPARRGGATQPRRRTTARTTGGDGSAGHREENP